MIILSFARSAEKSLFIPAGLLGKGIFMSTKERNDLENEIYDLVWDVKKQKVHPHDAYVRIREIIELVSNQQPYEHNDQF